MPAANPLRSYILSHAADLETYLCDLIRARTENPPGDEHLAAKVMTDFCDRYGIPYERFEKVPGRTNIVARLGQGRPSVLVALHFDVVPAGDGWQTDPFGPVVRDGVVYGRGAKDDKGPLAAMMLVARYFVEHRRDLPGQLVLVGCADEEAGSALGMKYLVEECGLSADLAIIPDAGDSMRLIDVGEKGNVFFKVKAVGRQAHGSEPERGASALWPVVDFLNRIRSWRPAGLPSDLFTPPTLNVGAIHAGTVPNIVPGRCEASVDIRYLPGTDGDAVLAHLNNELRAVEAATPGVKMEIEVLSAQPPTLVPPDHPMVACLQRRTEEVTGVRPKPFGMSGATVAKFLILRGVPTIGFTCGPEGGEHMAGECMPLGELAQFTEVMVLTLQDLMKSSAV